MAIRSGRMAVATARTMSLGRHRRPPRPQRRRDGQRTFRGGSRPVAASSWPPSPSGRVLLGPTGRTATAVTDISEVVFAALAVAATAWRAARTRHLGWCLISASCAAWLAGQLVWTWNEVVQHRSSRRRVARRRRLPAAIPLAFVGFLLLGFGGAAGPATAGSTASPRRR